MIAYICFLTALKCSFIKITKDGSFVHDFRHFIKVLSSIV